jgi:Sec-independent protein translocase protein TatA
MNRGITFSFVLVIMVISIFTFGSYQLVHATSTITNTDSQKKLTTDNAKNPPDSQKKLTTDNAKNPPDSQKKLTTDNAKNPPDSQKKLTTDNERVDPNQDPTILLPFTSNFADTQNGNDIPFP